MMSPRSSFHGVGLNMAAGLLSFLLFLAAGAMVMRVVIGEPDTVKSTIARSGVYNHLVDASLPTAQTTVNKEKGAVELPLNDPVIKDPLKQAFSPKVLQTNIEDLIDGTYRWLNGTVAQPDFVLDFGSSNETFIQETGGRLDARLRGLPACTPAELRTQREVEAFKATCLPPGVNISQVVQQAQSSLRGSKDLLPDQQITADTFKKPGEAQNIFASASKAPEQFRLLKQIPWMFLGLSALLATIIVLLNPSRREGLRLLGKTLTITGVLILLIPVGLYLAQSALINLKAIEADQLTKNVTLPLLVEFGKAAAKVYLIFGSLTAIIGGSVWLAASHLQGDMNWRRRRDSNSR